MKKTSCLLSGLLACLLASISHAQDQYDTLRLKWRQNLTGQRPDGIFSYNPADPTIAAVIDRIEADATKFLNGDSSDPTVAPIPPMVTTGGNGRTYLWSDLASTTNSGHITSCYTRLKAMALAHRTSGTTYYGDTALLAHIKGGLDWLYAKRYNPNITTADTDLDPATIPAPITPYGVAWDWRIGVPMAYNDIMVMLYDQLLGQQQMAEYTTAVEVYSRDTFYTSGSSTGANKVWRCMVVGLYGILTKNSSKLVMAQTHLVADNAIVFKYVEGGDGFYTDGSFIQHGKHPYNGGYGVVALYYGAELLNLLNGSAWEVTHVNNIQDNIFDWVYAAFEPLIYKGVMFTSVMGRNAASYDENRKAGVSDHLAMHKVVWALIRLAEFADAADAAAYKSMAKHWILADTSAFGFYSDVSADVAVKAKAIVADPAVPNRGELSLNKQYPRMDRVAHHRPGFAFGVSMFSSRVYNYESINGANLKGWHTGSGMTYLHNADSLQFGGNYWATINSHRLPGITVLSGTPMSGHRLLSGQSWVGGAEVADMFGVTGMQFRFPGKSLYAKKSWFMFDDEIVALGADIDLGTAEGSKVVESVIENRKLTPAGDNDFRVNDLLQPESFATVPTTHTGVNWAHLAGNVAGADIGYFFPGSATIKSLRETRSDDWQKVDSTVSIAVADVTDTYLNLYFDHGTLPTDATYAYVLLPNKTSAQVGSYAANPNITILENSSSAQAVTENTLGITAINFWQDAPKTVGGVTSANMSSFIMMADEELLDIGISDPTQPATPATMAYTINQTALSLNTALTSSGVTVTQLSPTIQFSVSMQYANGGTKRVAFNKAVVVDNQNANNSGGSTATPSPNALAWTTSTGTGSWGADFVHDGNTGKGSTKYFTFTPNLPVAGTYEVGFWYVAHAWRATNVPVEIVSSAGSATVPVNQQVNGSQWFSLGSYHFNAGTGGRVVVKTLNTSGGSNGNSFVAADAVRFRPVPSPTVIVDSKSANNTGGSSVTISSGWTLSAGPGNYGGDYVHDSDTGKSTATAVTFTPNLPAAGTYEVFVWHAANPNRATNVPVEINRAGGSNTVTVNQQINGSQWVSLGNYAFNAGTGGNVVIRTRHANNTNTNGHVVADAVRFVKL